MILSVKKFKVAKCATMYASNRTENLHGSNSRRRAVRVFRVCITGKAFIKTKNWKPFRFCDMIDKANTNGGLEPKGLLQCRNTRSHSGRR